MARLFLSLGEQITEPFGGQSADFDIFGTNDSETVSLNANAIAVFDPSFNRGGDTINIGGVAALYDATLDGSNLVLTAANGADITIPVGTVGATINFAGDARILIFDGTNVLLGDQILPSDGSTVDVEVGTSITDPLFVASSAAGADVLGITGTKSVRVDLTPTNNQIKGVDINGDGVIAPDGVENNPSTNVDDVDFEIIDAYLRDHLNYYNSDANFLGNLYVDGTGFAGDGIKDGNIILGGLGADIIFGGVGNDFIAGGGIAPTLPTPPTGDPVVDALNAILESLGGYYTYEYDADTLSGGRNADFFFAEFSTLSLAAGDALFIDAGTTADDTSAATGDSFFEGFVLDPALQDGFYYYYDYNNEYENHNYYPISSQDSDWFLPEVADDEEPIVINLVEGDAGVIFSEDQVSKIFASIFDVENIDASGNLYGFVDDLDVALGENGMVVDGENVGIGSSAQLLINGSYADNILIGGYDNDRIYGMEGNDLLFGGNLKYALNNPNAEGIINDGVDILRGGTGNDDIVFEADGGSIWGGYEHDTLWLTNQSLGWNNETGTYQTADNITTDGVLRFDLEADGLEDETQEDDLFQTAGYGGADVDGTQDQTNYGGDGVNPNAYRVDVETMNSVDATGMGRLDYLAAGGNPTMNPDPSFRNQQNHLGYDGDLDLRGTHNFENDFENVDEDNGNNNLFAWTGDDVLEGRGGNDWLMGGAGTDDFIFAIDGDSLYDAEDGLGEDFIDSKGNEAYDICMGDPFPYEFGEDECNYKGSGDGLDVILRKYDANGDNLWDVADEQFLATYGEGDFVLFGSEDPGDDYIQHLGNRYWDIDGDGLYDLVAFGVAEDMDEQPFPQVLWSQDFGLDDVATGNPSFLTIDFGDTNFSDPNVIITNFQIDIGGETFSVNAADLMDVQNADEIAAIVDARFSLQDSDVSVVAIGNTLVITDAAGREMSDTLGEGFVVSFALSNSFSEVFAMYSDQPPTIVEDRIIFKAYEDRSDNEGVDDDGITGSLISLGHDGYAEDLVVGFDKDGTRLAEDQFFDITFGNLTTEDMVTVTINGVDYCLQVGVDLDGTQVDAEDGVLDTQEEIQEAFLARLADFINTFTDDDTAAGSICAIYDPGNTTYDSDRTIRISQHAYAGEETVFIHTPTVEIENLSGGEEAFSVVVNMTETEVFLFGFDGRDGNLNEDNVQFIGEENISRSDLETASNAGETLIGKHAVVIDAHSDDLVMADGTDIPVNVAIDDELNDFEELDEDEYTDNFSVHGDDNQITGNGDDTVDGLTGDDFVRGSLGNDELDGGNDWYAVKYVGEDDFRVTYLSAYEAYNLDSDPDVADIRIIRQTENGLNTIGGTGLQPVPTASQYTAYFSDTLQYQQEDIDRATGNAAGTARFLVELDDFIQEDGFIIFDKGGAGHVTVDADGDGFADEADNISHFQNFENLRVVSGISKAVAGDGQGNDDLDLEDLSDIADQEVSAGDTVQDIGVCYDLTDSASAGGVFIIEDLDNDGEADNLRAVMRVDGVENVYFGDGDDTIQVDETEAAKDNIFDGDDGEDTVEYYNVFGSSGSQSQALEPMLTLVIESSTDTDEAIFTDGRLGTVVATDTLISFENIGLYGMTARNASAEDVLDVTNVSSDVTIDLHDGEIYGGSTLLATILGADESWAGIVQFENFVTDGGDDLVIVADAEEMCCNVNANDDPIDLEFDTYMNYDELDDDCVRLSVADLRASGDDNLIPEVTNFALFTFDLGDGDADRVDYSETSDSIAALVKVQDGVNYIFVDDDQNTNGLNTNSPFDSFPSEDCDRVDALIGVEEIVAANHEGGNADSLLDFTQFGMDSQITFQFDAGNISGFDYESIVRIADGDGDTVDGIPAYVEKYRLIDGDAATPDGPIAVWNRIEGGDFGETIIYEGPDDVDPVAGLPGLDHRFTNDELNLRGGANEVHYNPYNTSILTEVTIVASDGTANDASSTGMVFATVDFTDGTNALPGGGTHEISSYSVDNKIASGTLRIQASQDQEDTITFTGSTALAFGLTGELITVSLDVDGTPTETARFTGYEFIEDNGNTDDCYDITDYLGVLAGVTFVDNGGFSDHDTFKVHNDYFSAHAGATIDLSVIETDFPLDFDVLDVSAVTAPAFTTAVGSGGPEEIVVGAIVNLATINNFDSITLTQAAVDQNGVNYVLDTDAGTLLAGAKLLTFDADWDGSVSFNGTLGNGIDDPCSDSWIDAVTTDLNVTVNGALGAAVYGGDGDDTITGSGAGGDVIYGGLGADTLDGNRAGATLVLTLSGGTADSGTEAGNGELFLTNGDEANLLTMAVPTPPFEIGENADVDQIGTAFGNISLATWQSVFDSTDGGGGGLSAAEAGSLVSVSYDSLANTVTFEFAANADGSTVTAADLLAEGLIGTNGDAVLTGSEAAAGYTDGDDTFLYCDAAESTQASMDTVLNFSINTGGADDAFDISAIFTTNTDGDGTFDLAVESTTVANFAAAQSQADSQFASGRDGVVSTDGTNAWFFFDANQNEDLDAGDLVVMMAGIGDVSAFDFDNVIHGTANGGLFSI
ncbi:MAG: hypothetical protein R3E09_01865 [Novosphingobium sp.]